MSVHFALLSIGALFLLGLIADLLVRWTHVPRVTLLILAGLLIGPTGLDVLPPALEQWYEFLASAALSMVAVTPHWLQRSTARIMPFTQMIIGVMAALARSTASWATWAKPMRLSVCAMTC